MNKKEKNIELKIYELLGVKTFRKLVFKLFYISIMPYTRHMTREERYNSIYNTPSNYNMKKGHGIQDLRDFKKQLLLNAVIHIFGLIACISSFLNVIGGSATLFTTITTLFLVTINTYCIMLQRYNQIRINQVIKKGERLEEGKKNKLREELIKEDSLLRENIYKVVNKREEEKNITLEELLENATYEQLRQYRDYLSSFKKTNQVMERQQSCYTLDEKPSISVPSQKKKTLKLELKSGKRRKF